MKWPNDIYVESSSPNDESVKSPKIIKIGGVIVNSQYTQDELDEFLLIAGKLVFNNYKKYNIYVYIF